MITWQQSPTGAIPTLAQMVALADPPPGLPLLVIRSGHRAGQPALAIPSGGVESAGQGVADDPGAGCLTDGSLAFGSETFGCLIVHHAAHRLPNVNAFLAECARVLRPGGILGLADPVTGAEPAVARFTNTLYMLRDPAHHWAYTADDWLAFIPSTGLRITHHETVRTDSVFDGWAGSAGVSGSSLTRLRALLVQAPEGPRTWLEPRQIGDTLLFRQDTLVVLARKP